MTRPTYPLALALLVAVATAGRAAAVQPETFDLAGPVTAETRSVPAGVPLSVTVIHLAPSNDYAISLVIHQQEIAPFSRGVLTQGAGAAAPPCATLQAAYDALFATRDESELPARTAALRAAIVQTPGCDNLKSDAHAALALTTWDPATTYTLAQGDDLEVKVVRKANQVAGVKEKTWLLTLTTGPRGSWDVSYGFGFYEHPDEEFFSEAQDDGTFLVEREGAREDIAFAPAVFFSWQPPRLRSAGFSLSPTAGLGFDLSKPVVFLGARVGYQRNLGLAVGYAIRPEKRLAGRYERGQVLEENLGADQLHEETFGGDLFVALTFRFDGNPFKGGGDGKKSGGTAAGAGSGTDTGTGGAGSSGGATTTTSGGSR